MASEDLLARENEFKRLNKQLEKKTESLMKQIENVINKDDLDSKSRKTPNWGWDKNHTHPKPIPIPKKNVAKKPPLKNIISPKADNHEDNKKENINIKEEKSACTECEKRINNINNFDLPKLVKNTELEFLYAFVTINVQENVLPQNFLKERPTVESVCKFLSSKVKLMQEQIVNLQATIDKKASQCETHLTHQAELESERMILLNKTNSMKAATADMKAKCLALQNRMEEKDRLYKELRSEADRLTGEVKRLRAENASVQARRAGYEETVATLNHQLDMSRRMEKELQGTIRELSATHNSTISRLQARLTQSSAQGEKLTGLVYNLKRQNALLLTRAASELLQKQYSALLQLHSEPS